MKKIQKILSTLTIGYFIALVVAHILAVKFASEELLVIIIAHSLEIDNLTLIILVGWGLLGLLFSFGSIYSILFIKRNGVFSSVKRFLAFVVVGSVLIAVHTFTLFCVILCISLRYIEYDIASLFWNYTVQISFTITIIVAVFGRLQTETKGETQIDLM